MNRTDKALACFENFNCCQAVLTAFNKEIGLTEAYCLKLGAGFGGGMNCGETCGAVTGAYMVLGLSKAYATPTPESKIKMKEDTLHFNRLFREKQGSLLCKELLGVNVSLPEGRAFAQENYLFETRCPHFIASACRILDQLLDAQKKGA
ncbi:C-GCAxxG-C-C family protein [Mangrovibacterium diazotrophicum]|uniref:C_GCAxxG_C_C family probable redox protein n=1 Tax=Mangrovibacterium diazotrophicum TaxID=1261403 RepID=A0A419WAQ7_9BACT|nr:C-GCAxxG-C-C family protein [Mangrovibacterium diazotrophicum]RKD92496.1 C_GCAxxG_C_C family probable redox protein [Mangrovibacterium diazotrophicum]